MTRERLETALIEWYFRSRPGYLLVCRSQPRSDVDASLWQDVWWRNAEKRFLLIDDMDERYRTNAANLMLRNVDGWASRVWTRALWWDIPGAGYNGGAAPEVDPLDPEQITAQVREWLETGVHIEVLESSPLYVRLRR